MSITVPMPPSPTTPHTAHTLSPERFAINLNVHNTNTIRETHRVLPNQPVDNTQNQTSVTKHTSESPSQFSPTNRGLMYAMIPSLCNQSSFWPLRQNNMQRAQQTLLGVATKNPWKVNCRCKQTELMIHSCHTT